MPSKISPNIACVLLPSIATASVRQGKCGHACRGRTPERHFPRLRAEQHATHTKKNGRNRIWNHLVSFPASLSLEQGKPRSTCQHQAAVFGAGVKIATLTDVQLATLSAAKLAEPSAQRNFTTPAWCTFESIPTQDCLSSDRGPIAAAICGPSAAQSAAG